MNWPVLRLSMVAFLVLVPFVVMTQTPNPSAASPATTSDQPLKPEEIVALVAPIALYPDNLLAEVLMASTYPLEVVQADRWATANKNLDQDQLKAAVDKQPWDSSVKALVATPSVLTMMSTKLDWTQKLGDAFLAQQTDVMDAIQRLRAKAQANNKLTSTRQQTVTVRQEQNRQVIAIEPAEPNTVYVPYYDPAVVYGDWPYADYPPYYFPDYYGGYIGVSGPETGHARIFGEAVVSRCSGQVAEELAVRAQEPYPQIVSAPATDLLLVQIAPLQGTVSQVQIGPPQRTAPQLQIGPRRGTAPQLRIAPPQGTGRQVQIAPSQGTGPRNIAWRAGRLGEAELVWQEAAFVAAAFVAAAVRARALVEAAAFVEAAVRAQAGGDRILHSSTISLSSAVSTMVLAFIASATTAATKPMLGSSRRRYKQ